MDKFLDKVNVPTAVTNKTKMDLSSQRISTSDFMQLNVSKILEVVPGESVNINTETFARLNPLVVPTLGRASIKTSKFFVPFRIINKSFTDMLADTIHMQADGDYEDNYIPSGVPTISNANLVSIFTGATGTTVDSPGALIYPINGGSSYDVGVVTGYTGSSALVDAYNFTEVGRQIYKLLLDCGYQIVFDLSYDDNYSFMPLLALMRIYADWYFPTQYVNVSIYQKMCALFNYDSYNGGLVLDMSALRGILKLMCYVQYDSSVFVSAWDQPNSPAVGTYTSNYKLTNIDTISSVYGVTSAPTSNGLYSEQGYVSNNSGNSNVNNRVGGANAPFIIPSVLGTSNGSPYMLNTPISEYLLHGLHALTDFLKRHELVGSRAYERLLSRYGVSTPAEKINRSVFLGSDTQAIQIGDVMATADTDGAELGKMAGKGISYGQSNLNFETDEFGYVIILTSIVPITGYYQGCDPMVLRTKRFDFYVPEMDALGVEPVMSKTLYVPSFVTSSGYTNLPTQIFGFLPRYYSYKAASHDTLSGNFRCASLNGTNPLYPDVYNGASSWHLMRTFDSIDYPDASSIVHTPDFMLGQNDYDQWKRVFYANPTDKATAPDNFTIIQNFDIVAYAPMKSLYDSYEFEDEGKKVTSDVSGVKVN